MNLSIVGTGYVGLTTGTCFAEMGHNVLCVDNDSRKITMLSEGKCPIYEPGLEELIQRNMAEKRLNFTSDIARAVAESDVVFIAVPTPPQVDGSVDLSYIEEVSREIAESLTSSCGYKVIVDKSTVPVSTGSKVMQTIKTYASEGVDFDVVSNPEFLREGCAVLDLLHPDRIVIGSDSPRAMKVMKQVYQSFDAPILETDLHSAELIKHAANSFLALKISYINAVSAVCERSGADVELVAAGLGLDKRISSHFLRAGLGYGGSCFPKDVKGFIHISDALGVPFDLLKEVERINQRQMERFLNRIRERLWVLRNKKIAVWGLAFKQNTDDIRESVSIKLCRRMDEEQAIVRVYDPQAAANASRGLADTHVEICRDMYECVRDAEVLVIATEWEEFACADFGRVRELMHLPVIFDGRNLLEAESVVRAGFEYHSVGRRSAYPAKN